MATDALRSFQDALIARRVAARVAASYREGKQFPSQKALETYMKAHPGADQKKHWVKGDETPKEYAERKERQESGKPREFKDETPEEHKKRLKKIEKSKKDEESKKKDKSEFKDETEEEYAARKKQMESGKPREFKDETEAEHKARLKRLKDRDKK
jgi:hypothetical protein